MLKCNNIERTPQHFNMKSRNHGGDCYRNKIEYDFSININPFGMPRASMEAACQGIRLSGRYPDERGEALRKALARKEGVSEENILLGNGAAELIYALCHSLRPKKALAPAPCFMEYESATLAAGGKMTYYPLAEENGFNLDEGFLSAITEETEVVFLCNPGNPTGRLTEQQLLSEIALKCEKMGIWLCVDECFLPFLRAEKELTMLGKLQQLSHLVVLRAFTKVYGMPGLRLGYACLSSGELLDKMKASMQPWNTSVPAQMAGIAALQEDESYLEKTRRLIDEEKKYLVNELSEGLAEKVIPSEANFILFKSRVDLQECLLKEKILIRDCSNFENLMEGYFRIGIRTHEENAELIRRWKEAVRWQNPL